MVCRGPGLLFVRKRWDHHNFIASYSGCKQRRWPRSKVRFHQRKPGQKPMQFESLSSSRVFEARLGKLNSLQRNKARRWPWATHAPQSEKWNSMVIVFRTLRPRPWPGGSDICATPPPGGSQIRQNTAKILRGAGKAHPNRSHCRHDYS